MMWAVCVGDYGHDPVPPPVHVGARPQLLLLALLGQAMGQHDVVRAARCGLEGFSRLSISIMPRQAAGSLLLCLTVASLPFMTGTARCS